jgi:hypothetical protein
MSGRRRSDPLTTRSYEWPVVTPATTTGALPPSGAVSRRCALPAHTTWARRHRVGSHVHCCSVGGGGAQLFPCGPVVNHAATRHEPRPVGYHDQHGIGSPCKDRASRAPHGPAHIHRFSGWVSSLEGVRPLVHSCCTYPPRLPGPRDPMFPHVPSLSGLLPPDPRALTGIVPDPIVTRRSRARPLRTTTRRPSSSTSSS